MRQSASASAAKDGGEGRERVGGEEEERGGARRRGFYGEVGNL